MIDPELRQLECELVIEAAARRFGFDFAQYSRASLERRLRNLADQERLDQLSELIPKLLHEPGFIDRFVNGISVNVTEPFRDPECFAALREHVFPTLATYPYFKIWHAGCASGEEVYSLAVLLKEAGLLGRAQIYATDINTRALATARDGIYPEETLQKSQAGYLKSGGAGELSAHYTAAYGSGRFNDELRDAIVFSQHNLVTDQPFGEMVLILCRNVLIYFDRNLQDRALRLFASSLSHRGYLAIGAKESLTYLPAGDGFELLSRDGRVYRAR